MNVTDYAVDRPKVILVMTGFTLLLAFMAAKLIPVQRTPAINTAIVMVAVPYPGSEPTEVEERITRKIEETLQQLNNVDFIASTSMRGSSVTQVIFLDGVNAKQARADVEHLVNQVRPLLPAGREVQPIINEIDFESAPIMLITLAGPPGFDERTLKQIAEDVQDDLETIPGVSNTQLFGGREREIHVNVNPDLLSQYGLSINDVRNTLMAFHAQMPGGTLNSSQFDPQVRSETKFRGVDDVREAVISEREGRLIRVSDVANVQDTFRRLMNFAQLDGESSATIIVNKEANINSLGAARAIKERVEQLRDEYPHIKFSGTRDTSKEIAMLFENLGSDGIFGGLVVFVILAWAMGLRVSLLVVIAIPFSMAVALVFLYLGGYAISNMVIFSFIVAGGMVIDGAIIVADSIYRHLELGYDAKTAAKLGTHEVAVPVFAADLVTVAAFAPMMLVPGIMGDFMGVMPVVVCVSLMGSLIVDHFVVPALAAYWFRNFKPKHVKKEDTGLEVAIPTTGAWAPFYRGYMTMLRWSLHNRTVVMATCGMAVTWAALMLYLGFIGFTFFPGSDRGQFEIGFEMPLGYSIEQTALAAETIHAPLRELEKSGELVHYVTAVGSSSGLASRLEGDPAMGPEFGKVMVELVPPSQRKRHESEIIDWLRTQIKPVPGMTYRIDQVEEGPPGGSDVAVRFTGKNLDQLGMVARRAVERLRQVKGTVDVRTDYRPDCPEIIIEPRPEVVGLYGMTDMEVARSIQTAILGDTAIELSLDDEDVTLRLQADPDYQRYIEDTERLLITSPSGRKATVGELADVHRSNGLFSVNRRDHRRAVTVMCDVRKDLGVIPDDVFRVLSSEVLPEVGFTPVKGNYMAFLGRATTDADGVQAAFTGENEERDKGFRSLLESMVIGVVLIAGILVVQFNSIRQALAVMSTVPLSFVGVVLGMWLCRFDFSLASFIGLVSLTGVVVNDAIVLVDFVNEARKRGLTLENSLIEAGVKRSRAVLLTMLTSVGGMIPTFINMSGGGEFWQPLCGAIIFGLTVSAFLTLIVIPVSYSIAYDHPHWIRKLRGLPIEPLDHQPPAPELVVS